LSVGGQKFAGLLSEIKKDSARIENGNVPFHNGGQLGVWIDGKKFRFVLLAFACVDGKVRKESPFLPKTARLWWGLVLRCSKISAYLSPSMSDRKAPAGAKFHSWIVLVNLELG
jgi:hypothetical protein